METIEDLLSILKEDVEVLKKDVGLLKKNVASLKGSDFERRVRENTTAYFVKLFRRLRPIDKYALSKLLDDTLEESLIDEEERNDALQLDFTAKGKLKDEDKEVYIAVESSVTVDREGLERAFKRAMVLNRATRTETIPVVAFNKITEGAKNLLEELPVLPAELNQSY
ncbi:MAG: hypothetical protein D6674_02230 [Acidobacteria bacterium]|nr:MAG: hypothetical protein D6674_02230 [Acidobacteriota bacterium]